MTPVEWLAFIVLLIAGLTAGIAITLSNAAVTAAINNMARMYRRQKTMELEQARREEVAARVREVQAKLGGNPDAWRDVVEQLLVDARITFDRVLLEMGEGHATPAAYFAVNSGGPQYLFTPDPAALREASTIRPQDEVITLDASVSRFARIEAQALWDHIAPGVHDGQVALPRDASWYLVVHATGTWKPRRRKGWLRRLGLRK